MDLEAFIAAHHLQWNRLEALIKRRTLTGAEADELVRLYQVVATHLSTLRSVAPDPVLITRLSDTLARARTRIAGAHEPAWRDVVRFLTVSLPAALYRIRWWTIGVMVVFAVVAVAEGIWVATSPDALAAMGTPSERENYVNKAFAEYYTPTGGFAATVWTNNAWISAQAIAFGITGIFTGRLLFENAVSIGEVGGLMAAYNHLGIFFALITPHGLLELTSVFVAGAAGLRIFWTIVDPGPRPRLRALAEEGRALFTVVIGLVLALAVSGLIEAFVTGSGLPWWLKIAIGAVALAGFWTYILVLGRAAVRAGETGDLSPDLAGDVAPVAG